jgi:tetratricopeptide (TPR) repeat protein
MKNFKNCLYNSSVHYILFREYHKWRIKYNEKGGKSDLLVLTLTALFLFLIVFSSTAVAVSNGEALESQGNYEQAIKVFDKAIENNSQNSEAWYNKGFCYMQLGNYAEAIKAFDKAVEIDLQYFNAWYNKGYSLECLGNYKEAVKAFDKAIEINSQDSDTWYNRGTCLAHLGNYKEAEESLDKAIEIDPRNSQALRLKEAIPSNSNGLLTSLKSLFFNNDIFVKEDDLVEYSQTYLKTYKDIIYESNLTSDDLGLFSFYQSYPYSVNATISNMYGASITFIPHSINESKVTRITYPIEKLIPIINNEELSSPSIKGIAITGSSSNFSVVQNFYGGNVSSISDMKNYSFRDGFVYANNSSNNPLYKLTNAPIILGEKAHLNGLTYIDSNKVFRKGELIINGTLILNDSKVIVKSNLKRGWTKKSAKEDAIDFIYKEQIDGIFNYSKLTGIGFHEIETLVNNYETKRSTGYYQTHRNDQMYDLNLIYKKADQYKIHHSVIDRSITDIENEESSTDKILDIIDSFNKVYGFIGIIIAVCLTKRKIIFQKLKTFLRHFFRD